MTASQEDTGSIRYGAASLHTFIQCLKGDTSRIHDAFIDTLSPSPCHPYVRHDNLGSMIFSAVVAEESQPGHHKRIGRVLRKGLNLGIVRKKSITYVM